MGIIKQMLSAAMHSLPITGNRRSLVILSLLALLLAVFPPMTWGTQAFHTSVGFSISTFLDADKDRAQAISSLWTGLVAQKWGGTADTRICNSMTEFEQNILTGKLDVVVLLSTEYLALREEVPLEPLFVSARGTDIYDRLILVTRRDSGHLSLADLKGKTLLQQKGLYENGRNLWLDTLLMRKGIAVPEQYFLSDRKTLKPSDAIMSVFFGKADACIVTKRSLEVMAELNPQLKNELTILEESPPRPSSILAVRRGISVVKRAMLLEILGTLNQSPEGKQLLTLFKMNRLATFRPQYLVPIEKLFREYHVLKNRMARRKYDASR
jgi:ABC-type phosphate/phosphonate transport system substrate-binding protein